MHCFGDGATWPGIPGWGIYARDKQGNILSNTADRTPGKQQNDASEAFAILQGLINTNPMDPIKLYCDNQGCVKGTLKANIEGTLKPCGQGQTL